MRSGDAIRTCKDCKVEKELSEFYKTGKWYRRRCKKCHDLKFKPRTGLGRGSWNRGTGTAGGSLKFLTWKNNVYERDNHTCQECSSLE